VPANAASSSCLTNSIEGFYRRVPCGSRRVIRAGHADVSQDGPA
jgi:hypothetical protein